MVTESRMSQIMFEKFLRPVSNIHLFLWLEPESEQWMEHKVEQNLNKTSATDLGGQEPDPEWFGFLSLAPITPRRVPSLRSKSESEYFDSKCYYFYFLWIWVSGEHKGGIKFQSHFFQFPDLIIDRKSCCGGGLNIWINSSIRTGEDWEIEIDHKPPTWQPKTCHEALKWTGEKLWWRVWFELTMQLTPTPAALGI